MEMSKMKRLIAVACLLFAVPCFAGELRDLPQSIVLTNPTTNKVELMDLTFHYGANPYATINYHVLDADGNVRGNHTAYIRNVADDPATTEDETSTAFTDFVSGYGATLYSRGDVRIWADIQRNYDLQ